MRFQLIDRITSLEPEKSITAIKNLSLAEEYLADHFPGFPVMPGVLMLEALIQTGAWLMRYSEDFAYSTVLLKEAKAIRYNNFVTPGQTLTVTASVRKRHADLWEFNGSGTVEGASAVSARISLRQFNLAADNAQLAESDAVRVKAMRELFAQIWKPPAAAQPE